MKIVKVNELSVSCVRPCSQYVKGPEFKSGSLIPKSTLPTITPSCCTNVAAGGKLFQSSGLSNELRGRGWLEPWWTQEEREGRGGPCVEMATEEKPVLLGRPWRNRGSLGEVSSCERRGQEERGLGDESLEQPGLVSFIQSGKRKPSGRRGTATDQSLSPPQCWETQTWRGRVE